MGTFSKYVIISLPLAVTVGVAVFWWIRKWSWRQYERVGVVSGLEVFPIKGCGGMALQSADCGQAGIKYDRQWAIFDENGSLIALKEKPSLALIKPVIVESEGCLVVKGPGMDTLRIPLTAPGTQEAKALRVNRVTGEGKSMGEEAADWFSRYLGQRCALYCCTGLRHCATDSKWGDLAQAHDKVRFGYTTPYHLTTEKSLESLNQESPTHITMERFRSNIVIGQVEGPYIEDEWKRVRIADVEFRLFKTCGRCLITTVDPETGKKESNEPLTTLQRSGRVIEGRDKRHGNSPSFGIQLGLLTKNHAGVIRIGDPVFISTQK